MSDDEVESFNITDYDLDNEFNINRPRRKLTKEQQMLGIWADSDEEPEENSRRNRNKKSKDFSMGSIGFVAGGIQQPGKKEEIDDESKEPTVEVGSSSEEEDKKNENEDQIAGLRRRGFGAYKPQSLSGGVGNWEKYTKGIGAKLLLQMGYQPGKGLGKSLQGMSTPITAAVRKGRGAIGAYGPEVKMKKGQEPEEETKAIEEKEKSNQWKRSHKKRYFYKNAEDVIQEGKPSQGAHTEKTSALAKVTVIDLRGPEKRVLSGYHALRAAAPRYEDVSRKECVNLALPELMHNLNLLVDMCEQEIIDCSREGHAAEDRKIALERDMKDLKESIKHDEREINALEKIIIEIKKLDRLDLSLDEAYEVFRKLQTNFPTEYDSLGFGNVNACGSCLRSLVGAALATWLPLRNPHAPVTLLEKWTPLLSPTAIHEVFWRPWLEQVQLASLEWDVREPSSMKSVIDAWIPIAPQQEIRTILRSAIVPRLSTAAMRWDPTVDTLPLHYWILPWHQYAGDMLEESVYPELRSRLVSALSAWHPADGSALALLRPWSQAWSLALPALARAHILPRLEACMRTVTVEPEGNPNENWGWCASWQEIIGARALAGAAGRALLPRWLASLASWLNRRPPHAHLISHYSSWKAMFSEELLREPELADAFRKALDMMNRSMDSPVTVIPIPMAPPAPRISGNSQGIAEVIASINQQKSFTELLESRCMERGVSLVPLVGRSRDGRPLYRLGTNVQCYVMRNVVMHSNDLGRTFQPISLDSLLQLASN